jgi:hypothetical protein
MSEFFRLILENWGLKLNPQFCPMKQPWGLKKGGTGLLSRFFGHQQSGCHSLSQQRLWEQKSGKTIILTQFSVAGVQECLFNCFIPSTEAIEMGTCWFSIDYNQFFLKFLNNLNQGLKSLLKKR